MQINYYTICILLLFLIFGNVNCIIEFKTYSKPSDISRIGNNGNCSLNYKFLAISNSSDLINTIVIGSIGSQLASDLVCDNGFQPIVKCSLTIETTTTNAVTEIEVVVNILGGIATSIFFDTKCYDQFSIDYKLISNSNLFVENMVTNKAKPPLLVAKFYSDSYYPNYVQPGSAFDSEIRTIQRKFMGKSRIYSLEVLFKNYFSYYKDYNFIYNSINKVYYLEMTSGFKPVEIMGMETNSIYPAQGSSINNIISTYSIQFNSIGKVMSILIHENGGCAFPVGFLSINSNISKIFYVSYFNENSGPTPFYSPLSIYYNSTQMVNRFNNSLTINYPNYQENKEMEQSLIDTNASRPFYTLVLSGTPMLPTNPFSFSYPCGYKVNLMFNTYPFGLKNGFNDGYDIGFSSKVSSYLHGSFLISFNSQTLDQPNTITYPGKSDSFNDTQPPSVISNKYITDLGRMKLVIEISIVDSISGFSTYVCLDNNKEIFGIKDLSSGDIKNGTYKFIYDYGFTNNCSNSAFLDNAGNALVLNEPFLNFIQDGDKYYLMNQLPIIEPKGLDDIKYFYFKYNNINLTNSGFYNTLYFNFNSGNNPDYVIKFRLDIAHWWTTPKVYYSYWDASLNLYKVEFYLPANLMNMDIQYSIFMGLDSETEYTTQHIQSMTTDATLSVYSDSGDMMPPIVSSLKYPKNTVINKDTNLTWTIWVEDLINGFDYGEISIVNSNDRIPWNFEFSSSGLRNIKNSTYSFSILVPNLCTNSSYYIQHLKLVDKSGCFSEYTYGQPQTYPIINPLVRFSNELDKASISCTNQFDFDSGYQSPFLESLSFSPTSIDAGHTESSRLVTFYLSVIDQVGIRNKTYPTIYLNGDGYFNYIKVPLGENNIESTNGTRVQYQITTVVPYGFGYPEGIYVNVFGIQSVRSIFQGYASNDLKKIDLNYTISVPSFTVSAKMLYSSPISNQGGEVTIYGRQFSMTGTKISIQYSSDSIIEIIPTAINELAFKFNVLPTNNSFTVKYINVFTQDSIVITPYIDYWKYQTGPGDTPEPVTNPPKFCGFEPLCGGPSKGYCQEGVGCICLSPWVGYFCRSRTIIIPPPIINPNNPSVNLTTNSTGTNEFTLVSLVSLVSLRELNFNDSLVKQHIFEKWTLISNTSTNSFYTTDVIDPISKVVVCTVSVSTVWFEELTNITFAGQQLVMNPSTLKYNVNITSYPFDNKLNTLQLVMQATAKSRESETTCSSNEFGYTTSNENSNFIQLSVNDHSLYGRFIKRGIVDNKIVSIGNVQLNELSSENSYYTRESYIGINIPFFTGLAQLDPDFSVLVDSNDGSSSPNSICKGSDGISRNAIIGIVVGVVGGAIVIVIAILLLTKYKYHIKIIKLRAVELKIRSK